MNKIVPDADVPDAVEPPEGWNANCKYGIQRCDASDAGRLVRLEDVAGWLAESQPRDAVLIALFSPLIAEYGAEIKSLYVLNAQNYAVPLIRDGLPNIETVGFWQFLRDVDRKTLPEYVARDLEEEWRSAWPGLADPATDDDWTIKRVIQNNRVRNERAKQIGWANMPTAESIAFGGKAKTLAMDRLRKLSIPLIRAYALWGYGTALEQVPEVQKNATTPATFEEYAATRDSNKPIPWTAKLRQLFGRDSRTQAQIAKVLGISKSAVGDQWRTYRLEEKARIAAGPLESGLTVVKGGRRVG